MPNNFEPLDSELEDKDGVIAFPNSMFKLGEFIQALKESFQGKGLDEVGNKLSHRGGVPTWKEYKYLWFHEGINVEILRLKHKVWQQGKVRIKVTLEFCLDEQEVEQTSEITEPESPLDDLRRMINE
jgi:hypothetical protein